MSSSTKAIVSKSSTMNNNERKRPLSSSIRLSPSPTTAKRRGFSSSSASTISRHHSEHNERIFHKSTDINDQYSTFENPLGSTKIDSNENPSMKKLHSHKQSEFPNELMYTKRTASIPLIVKSSTSINDQGNLLSNYDSDEESERIKSNGNHLLNKSTHVVVPSNVMTLMTTGDLSKKSMRTENNVIIQQVDGNVNPSTSTKLVTLVVPTTNNVVNSSASIKMLSSGDGLASALRVPTKIQLTKTLFVASGANEKTSQIISAISSQSISADQSNLSPTSSILLDIPMDMTEKQQTRVDYHSSTTLPPTPPPPVVDQRTSTKISNGLHHRNQEQEQQIRHEASTQNIQELDETSKSLEHSKHSSVSKRNFLQVPSSSDWSVPPTIELSPTSITSSSPDICQNPLPVDDFPIEFDSSLLAKRSRSLSSSCSLLPSVSMCFSDSKDFNSKRLKSKSLSRLSNSTMKTSISVDEKNNTTTSKTKVSSSPRLRRRRRDNENLVFHHNGRIYKSKMKQLKIEYDDQTIIHNLLDDIIERIVSTSNPSDYALKNLLITPVSQLSQSIPIDLLVPKRTNNSTVKIKTEAIQSRTTSVNKKRLSLSKSFDFRSAQNESRSMIMTPKELDELAYLLHANAHRGEFDRNDDSSVVEQRMREMWAQMSSQKKNAYYKRVIQIYKRPNRDVVIASSSLVCETNILSKNDETDNTNSSSMVVSSVNAELQRQTSTPLSFHSIASSATDEQSLVSPQDSMSKTAIFADIVNELIKGAKGLDKLSCNLADFTNSIHAFVRANLQQQMETLNNLEQSVEKTCSLQLSRATIFWDRKINYFAAKHSIETSDEYMNELKLIVKYFYLFVLSLNCQKQKADSAMVFTDLLNGKLTFNESFSSVTLTSIIEDLILRSSLANDYLASQLVILDQVEHSLPFVRNTELENDLLNRNDTYPIINPFANLADLEEYLTYCERMTAPPTPCYQLQQHPHPAMYYPPYHHPSHYYYRPPAAPPSSTDMNNYYYNPSAPYPTSSSMYQYNPSTSYYHHAQSVPYGNNEQYQSYYYPSQSTSVSYPTGPNSNTMDIPSTHKASHHRTQRQLNSNMSRKYNKSQSLTASGLTSTSTPTVFDTTTVVSPQSKSMNTTNTNYPP